MSHIKSIAVQKKNGKWVTIPSVFRGVQLTQDQAKDRFLSPKRKLKPREFDTVEEAVKAGKRRSRLSAGKAVKNKPRSR